MISFNSFFCCTSYNDFLFLPLGIPDLTVVPVRLLKGNIRDIRDLDRIPSQDQGLDLVRHIIVTACICEDEGVVPTTNHECRITEDFVRIGVIITIISSIVGTVIIIRTTDSISIASTIGIITINTEMIAIIRSKHIITHLMTLHFHKPQLRKKCTRIYRSPRSLS